MRIPSAFAQHRILGGAMVLASMQFCASLMGLVRDRVLAQTFPGLGVVDVYIASFRPSDLLFQVVIMAGFSVAVVPLLAQYKAKNDQLQMSSFLSGVVTVAAIGFGLLALVAAIFFPVIAPFITQFEGESLKFYITFGRIALLTNFLFVFGNAFGQYLITIQRYWFYGLTPILYTLGTIFGTIFLTPVVGPYGPILGTLGGAILYVIIRFIGVVRAGYRPRWTLWHPDLPEMGRLMLPRMLALGALQLELLLFDTVASGLAVGSVTINAYARNFQGVAVGIVGIALICILITQSGSCKGGDPTILDLFTKSRDHHSHPNDPRIDSPGTSSANCCMARASLACSTCIYTLPDVLCYQYPIREY